MHTGKDIHTHTHTPITGLDIPIFTKLYDLYKVFIQYLNLFPKGKKYTIGQKIDQTIIDMIELVIVAGYMPREQKLPSLQKVSIKLDLLKVFLRIAFETKCLDNNKYQLILSQTLEIGRMLGGWIKTIK